jgi:hypothetical protein
VDVWTEIAVDFRNNPPNFLFLHVNQKGIHFEHQTIESSDPRIGGGFTGRRLRFVA